MFVKCTLTEFTEFIGLKMAATVSQIIEKMITEGKGADVVFIVEEKNVLLIYSDT